MIIQFKFLKYISSQMKNVNTIFLSYRERTSITITLYIYL